MAFGLYDEREAGLLPHPAIGLPVYLIIENALNAAWDLLRNCPREGFDLRTASEDAITLELYEALYDRVFDKGIVDGFDSQLFVTVEREAKVRNYNYTHPDKMPDLLIRLVGRPAGIRKSQDAVFIECKPVDQHHGVRGHYCDKGLVRFVLGDYAWAMTNALMVGYSKEGYTVFARLMTALQKWPHGRPLNGIVRPCAHSKATPNSQVVHSTEHARKFNYCETGQAASPITIRHLWLKRG